LEALPADDGHKGEIEGACHKVKFSVLLQVEFQSSNIKTEPVVSRFDAP
jgi:hypothetical protein